MTQTQRLVRYLREHPGATILDITHGLDPFVANPRARISDARAAGHVIERRKVDGLDRYYIDPLGQQRLGLL